MREGCKGWENSIEGDYGAEWGGGGGGGHFEGKGNFEVHSSELLRPR